MWMTNYNFSENSMRKVKHERGQFKHISYIFEKQKIEKPWVGWNIKATNAYVLDVSAFGHVQPPNKELTVQVHGSFI